MVNEPRSTVTERLRTVLREIYGATKYLANIILGCLCCALLSVMGCCIPTDTKKDKRSTQDSVRIASLDEDCDLESQARPWARSGSWENNAERTRIADLQSHDTEDERLSAEERHGDLGMYRDIPKPPNRDSNEYHDGENMPGASRDKAESTSAPDEREHPNDNMTDAEFIPGRQQNQENEAVTTDDLRIRDMRPAPSRPFLFNNETTRRFFLAKADACSESEVMVWCKSLNSRINSLSAHLLREVNKTRGPHTSASSSRRLNIQELEAGDDIVVENRLAKLVEKALGSRLYGEIIEARRNGETSSVLDASIQDGLDAWSVFCVHLAMQPILFGLKLRTVDEVEEIFRQMVDHEPEQARCWNCIRLDDPPRSIDPRIQMFVRDICPLTQPRPGDIEGYSLLEEVYRRDFVSEHRRQMSLHWRALLHKHELGLASYHDAISQTEKLLSQGLQEIFSIAGVELPPTLSNGFRDMIEKIAKDASKLAQLTKTAIFSQSIEVVIVKPGSPFDRETMKATDEGDDGEVKCTIQLGLHLIDSAGERTILVIPEVLLG